MRLDKKQIPEIFLFKLKMGHKAAEKTCKIKNAFGPETANELNSAVVAQEVLQRRLEP